MISRLTGNIAHTDIKYVVIDVNGVGYKVFINSDIFTKIAKVGKGENSITLWTYTAVRENALDLYGFLSLAELNFFELYEELKEKNTINMSDYKTCMKKFYLMAIERENSEAMFELGQYYGNIEKNYCEMKIYYH